MLPERPGGWVKDENGLDKLPQTTNDHAVPDTADTTVWDWKRTEEERRKGLEYAQHFASLDGLLNRFDPGEDGPLGRFGPG